jgi:hypothetical protein
MSHFIRFLLTILAIIGLLYVTIKYGTVIAILVILYIIIVFFKGLWDATE